MRHSQRIVILLTGVILFGCGWGLHAQEPVGPAKGENFAIPEKRIFKTIYVDPTFKDQARAGSLDPDHLDGFISATLVHRTDPLVSTHAIHISLHRVPDLSADFTIRLASHGGSEALSLASDASSGASIFGEEPGPHKAGFLEPTGQYHFPVLGFDDQEAAVLAQDDPQSGASELVITFYSALGRTLYASALPLDSLAPGLRLRLSPPETEPPDLPSMRSISEQPVTPMTPPNGAQCDLVLDYLGTYVSPNRPTIFDITTYYSYPYSYFSGYASTLPNPCWGTYLGSRIYSSYGALPSLDFLDTTSCGNEHFYATQYACGVSMYGRLFNDCSGGCQAGWPFTIWDTFYRNTPDITLEVKNQWNMVTPTDSFSLPYMDRHDRNNNLPVRYYNLTFKSIRGTVVKVTSTYDGPISGHQHAGRPLVEYYTGSAVLGVFYSAANITGTNQGTEYTFTVSPGVPKTISYRTTGFGGADSIKYTGNADHPVYTQTTKTWRVFLRHPNIQQLPQGGTWIWYGMTDSHPSSHWGIPNMVTMLKDFAGDYYNWTGGDPNLRTPERLRYNDMSLIHGGPFDAPESPDPFWNDYAVHQLHRDGRSVDVAVKTCYWWADMASCQSRTSNAGLTAIKLWIAEAAFNVQVERYPGLYSVNEGSTTHYHLQMGYD